MAFHRVICIISLRDMRHFTSLFIIVGFVVCVKMKYHYIGTTRRKRSITGVETML